MSGNIATPTDADFHEIAMPDGSHRAVWLRQGLDTIDLWGLARPAWDELWTQVGSVNLAASQSYMIEQMLRKLGDVANGGNWVNQVYSPDWLKQPNTLTWIQLNQGGSIVDEDGQTYTGTYAVNELFFDWLERESPWQIDTATEGAAQAIFGAWLEIQINALFAGYVPPPAPPPPLTAAQMFPPGQVGAEPTAYAWALQEGTRPQLVLDTSQPSGLNVKLAPIPT